MPSASREITSALIGRNDYIFQDKLNHASLIDAARVVDAKLVRYRHLDLAQLQAQITAALEQKPQSRRLVMTDAVFSMDGDIIDLPEIISVCKEHGALLMGRARAR